MMQSALDASIPHNYPLAVRDSGVAAAIGLLMRSLPYAVMRFAVLLAFSVAAVVWAVITIGGSVWAAAHIAGAFGFAWFVSCAIVAGWFWTAILRYVLHMIECGHVAVLTELIVHGKVGNGTESMFDYGKRVVTEKFGQVNALFAMNLLVRGVVNSVHATIEGIGHMLPIPGIESIGKADHRDSERRHAVHGQGDLFVQPRLRRNQSMAERAGRPRLLRAERQADPQTGGVDRGAGARVERTALACAPCSRQRRLRPSCRMPCANGARS